jgi:hypothetical protein
MAMKHPDVIKLLDLWDRNPQSKTGGRSFRDHLKADAAGACGDNGVNLEQDDGPALKSTNWNAAPADLVLQIKIRP